MTAPSNEETIDLMATHPDRAVQSTRELLFALTIEPCGHCGAFLPDHREGVEFEILYQPKGLRVWASCVGCGRLRSLQARAAAEQWTHAKDDNLTVLGPSMILQPHLLLQAYDRTYPQIWREPSAAPFDERGGQNRLVSRARICTKELCKFLPEGGSEIPEHAIYEEGRAYHAAHRERYTRAYLEGLRAEMDAIHARYVADQPRYEAEYLAKYGPPKESRGDVNLDHVRAHLDWVQRGRTGPGQVDVFYKSIYRYNLIGADIIAGKFQEVEFERCGMVDAMFDESTLTACTVKGCNARGAKFKQCHLDDCSFQDTWLDLSYFTGAVLQRCVFKNTPLTLSTWSQAVMTSCTLSRLQLSHSVWDGAVVKQCDFSRSRLGLAEEYGHLPASMRGARFEDCDFRWTGWYGRDLSGVTFVRCRFEGARGAPSGHEGLVLEDCDLSRDEFLDMLVSHQARQDAIEAKVAEAAKQVVAPPASITTAQELEAAIGEAVALVVSGEANGFNLQGQVPVDRALAERFELVYRVLTRAATAAQAQVVLRWVFDIPQTIAAEQRNTPNAEALLTVLEGHAVDGKLPPVVQVQFVNYDRVPPTIGDRMAALGVERTQTYLPGVYRGP